MKHLLILLTIAPNLFAGEYLLHDGSGVITGKYLTRDNDPRIVPAALPSPILDKRGFYRLFWNGTAIVVIAPASRTPVTEIVGAAWIEWANLKVIRDTYSTELDTRPALKAYVVQKLAEKRAIVDELLRAGTAQDEP